MHEWHRLQGMKSVNSRVDTRVDWNVRFDRHDKILVAFGR
jgi:hypothetical protein